MGVLNVQGGSNGLPIPSEALMAQLVNMKKVGGMLESERQAVIDLVVFIYGTEVAPDYYYPMVEGFLGHQIIHRSIVECGAHKIEQLPALIESRMGRTKIGRKKGVSIISDFRRTVTTQPIPTGFDIIDTPMMGGLPRGEYGILCAYTGVGKCLGRGTRVLAFDGSIALVEDIREGDLLMGPDSKPRKVLSITRGREEMFQVDQRNGDSFTCNRSHILSLKRTGHIQTSSGPTAKSVNRKGEIVNISVNDYLAKKPWFRHFYKAWKTAVEFPEKNLPLDPYLFGLWLGDGTSKKPEFTTGDWEIEKEIRDYAKLHDLKVNVVSQENCDTLRLASKSRSKRNILWDTLKKMGVVGNKHIPQEYLTSSREQRLKLLAGLIDTDGYCPKRSVAIFTSIRKELADQVLFLARSLGFMSTLRTKKTTLKSRNYTGIAYNVTICGDVHTIPTKLPRRRPDGSVQRNQQVNSFTLTSIGEGDYFGFTLEGDGLFLLGDFTVTHNTTAALNFAAGAGRMGFKTCFFTLELTEEKIRERLYSLIGRYNYDRIRYGDPQKIKTKDEIWAEVEEAVRLNGTHPNGQVWADNIRIFDFSRDTCSLSHIEDCIKEEQDDDPENPPAQAMIDWLLCLDESPGYDPRKMGPGEMRHKLQRYSDEISKKICRGHNVSCWATHQADAKAEEEDKITMAHAAEGKSVGWKCSTFIGIGASSKNRQDNIFTVNASKMRDGRLFTGRLKGHLHEQRFEDMTEADQQVIQQTSSITEDLILSRQMAQRRLQETQKQEGVILPK